MSTNSARQQLHRNSHVRVETTWTHEEYKHLKALMESTGLHRSDVIRSAVLGVKMPSTLDAQLVNTLSKLGGLQIKLNTELRNELQNSCTDNRVNELIKTHNDLYRDICNCIRELRKI